MAKDKEPDPTSVARAKRIHEQIDRMRKKGPDGAKESPSSEKEEGVQPRSLRDIIHDRMEKLDRKKGE
jgi:hypothetical protein